MRSSRCRRSAASSRLHFDLVEFGAFDQTLYLPAPPPLWHSVHQFVREESLTFHCHGRILALACRLLASCASILFGPAFWRAPQFRLSG